MNIVIVPYGFNVTDTLARRIKERAKKLPNGENMIGKIKVIISEPLFDGHNYRYCIILGGN